MLIRPANTLDADEISDVFSDLVAAGIRENCGSPEFMRETYIDHPDRICCSVAVNGEQILGFQSLRLARESNPYGTPAGWGIIGRHIRPSAARRGVGAKLFAVTKNAAFGSGLRKIEACIGNTNTAALAYYEATGFVTYERKVEGAICKFYAISKPYRRP